MFVGATIAILLLSVLGIGLSHKLSGSNRSFGVGISLASGVMLATAFVHLIPETLNHWDGHSGCGHSHHGHSHSSNGVHNHGSDCSGSGGCGHDHSHHHHQHGSPQPTNSTSQGPRIVRLTDRTVPGGFGVRIVRPIRAAGHPDHDEPHTDPYPIVLTLVASAFIFLVLLQQIVKAVLARRAAIKESTCCDSHHHHPPKVEDSCQPPVANNKCCDDVAPLANMSQVSAYAMFMAMCFHAVVEGTSLGVTKSTALWSSFLGIALHKVFEAFAVGASLVEARVPRVRFIIYSVIFCLSSPLGAVIGFMARSISDSTDSKAVHVLTAIAAGTFIQVAVMEMLPKVFETPKDLVLKMVALVAGFGAICASTAAFPHSH